MLVELVLPKVGRVGHDAQVLDQTCRRAHGQLQVGQMQCARRLLVLHQPREVLLDVLGAKVGSRSLRYRASAVVGNCTQLVQLHVLLRGVHLYQAFLHAELDEQRFEVGVHVVVEKFGHTQFTYACIGKADAHGARLRGFRGDLDSEYYGRVLDVAAELVFQVLQVAG
jgi:hypothetical protein